jgi:ribose transport system substrate-binding protein
MSVKRREQRSRSRPLVVLTVACVAALLLAACGGDDESATAGSGTSGSSDSGQAKKRIGFVLPDLSNPVIAGFRDGAVAEAKKRGWEVLVKGTSDAKAQSDAVLSFIAAKVDLIAMDPIDGDAMAPTVEQANAAKIPVIAFQSKPAGGDLATFIFPSETVAGTFMGKGAVEHCQKQSQNPCQVGIIEGNLGDSSGKEENEAFKKAIAEAPGVKVVGANPTDYDPAKALNVATNLLTAHPDLDYLYAWWDQGGAAAVEAVKARNKQGKVGISSQNGDCLNLQHVVNGDQFQDSVFFPSIQGGILIKTAADVLDGKDVPAEIQAPVMSVTTDKANAWLGGDAKPTEEDVVLGQATLADVTTDIMARLKDAKAGNCPK